MKVFHILSNPNIGGIERMLSNLIPRVDRAKCDMYVVNMRTESTVYKLCDQTGARYHRLNTPAKVPLGSILKLARLLRREKPDVIEIYGLRANIIGRLAGKFAGVPIIITGVLCVDDWRKWYHAWLDRLTGWAVTSWIPNSKACMRDRVEREKHPPERFEVIYDGIDTKAWTRTDDKNIRLKIRKELNCASDDIMVTTVGNLRHQKGYPFLIEAIPKILEAKSHLHFVFVGNGVMEKELKQQCKELGIEESVTFAGYRDDIKDIYEASDIALLPSLYEGLPICLIEAMSMELPVISTTVSGIPELVDDGVTGILIPPKNVEAIEQAVLQMAANPQKLKQMGKTGRERVCKMFSIDRMIEELLAYYQLQIRLRTGKDK